MFAVLDSMTTEMCALTAGALLFEYVVKKIDAYLV